MLVSKALECTLPRVNNMRTMDSDSDVPMQVH